LPVKRGSVWLHNKFLIVERVIDPAARAHPLSMQMATLYVYSARVVIRCVARSGNFYWPPGCCLFTASGVDLQLPSANYIIVRTHTPSPIRTAYTPALHLFRCGYMSLKSTILTSSLFITLPPVDISDRNL